MCNNRRTHFVIVMEFFVLTIVQLLTFFKVNSFNFDNTTFGLTTQNNLKHFQEFDISYTQLRISSLSIAPFMYKDNHGKLSNGIEQKLFKVIAEVEHLELSFSSHKSSYNNEKVDIFAGGLFPNSTFCDEFTCSKRYSQDDLTWCIKKSTNFPMIRKFLLAATPELWLSLIFGVGFTSACLLHVMIQFDLKYERGNQRDWNYIFLLIAVPGVIGVIGDPFAFLVTKCLVWV